MSKEVDFDHATHVPLIVHVPWIRASHGRRIRHVVELVDVLPTLLELARISRTAPLHGRSLVPLLEGANHIRPPGWGDGWTADRAAYTQNCARVVGGCRQKAPTSVLFGTHNYGGTCEVTAMSYSIRTLHWRYTRIEGWNDSMPWWGVGMGALQTERLFNHTPGACDTWDGDPASSSACEQLNLAGVPEATSTKQRLFAKLVAHRIDAGPLASVPASATQTLDVVQRYLPQERIPSRVSPAIGRF